MGRRRIGRVTHTAHSPEGRIALFAFAACVAAAASSATAARADLGSSCAVVSRSNVATCALGASAGLVAEREGAQAAIGRRTAAAPWFPSNPVLSLSAGRRSATEGHGPALNYSASLAQEIEVAGQRASRRRAADADVAARTNDVVATSRTVAANAYVAYFDVLAARDALALARRLEATGSQVARVTRARADAGVTSALDAEVTEAALVRLVRGRLEASQRHRVALVVLATLLGREPHAREGDDAVRKVAVLRSTDGLGVPVGEQPAFADRFGG